MPKRSLVRIEDVASWGNLLTAYWRAAAGRRHQSEVRSFASDLNGELAQLRTQLLSGRVEVGAFRTFQIHDPKPRTIHAPAFRERVLHHALVAYVGPAIERSLVDDTYACRVDKGALAAVRQAQRLSNRFAWFARLDARQYFASIDHQVLRSLVGRRIKGRRVTLILEQILASYETAPGKGLPIGALTSQQFANLYLAPLDRFLLQVQRVRIVRYMDDVGVWGATAAAVRLATSMAKQFARDQLRLHLAVKQATTPSRKGAKLCGFRVFPDRLLLSDRRRRRYRRARREWESAYSAGLIGSQELQRGYASALAITAHSDARDWRQAELARRPALDA